MSGTSQRKAELGMCKVLPTILISPRTTTAWPRAWITTKQSYRHYVYYILKFKEMDILFRFTKKNWNLIPNQPNQILAKTGCLKANCHSRWLRLVLSTPFCFKLSLKFISCFIKIVIWHQFPKIRWYNLCRQWVLGSSVMRSGGSNQGQECEAREEYRR